MHNIKTDDLLVKIVTVNKVEYEDHKINAVVTTNHCGRVTTKPYEFELSEWAKIIERGWVE